MTTTCGIFLFDGVNRKLLIGHATRSKNFWSIPKGLQDEGETTEEAAFRELFEETNIKKENLEIQSIHKIPPAKYLKQNKILESFLLIAKNDLSLLELKCNSLVNNQYPEIDQFMWVDLNEFAAKAHETQSRHVNEIKILIEQYGKIS